MSKRERKEAAAPSRKKVKLAHPPAPAKARPPPRATSTTLETSSSDASGSFYVAAGSYERFLYGLECRLQSGKRRQVELKPIFHFPAHLSCIKALAFSPVNTTGKVTLVSGGTDEAVKIWDVRSRKEVGLLNVHGGACKQMP
jgi:WD40 repeat protein